MWYIHRDGLLVVLDFCHFTCELSCRTIEQFYIKHHWKKTVEGAQTKQNLKLRHRLTMIYFDKFYDCFSDAGYIAFTFAASRLGVFMEDPLISDFMEGFVFYLCNHIWYINNSRRWLGVNRFLLCCRRATINSIKLFHPKTIQ